MCLLPIAFLILVTVVKRIHLKTTLSLPLSAFIFYVIRLAYFGLSPHFTHGAVLYGLFDAFTPLSILTGAVILFQAMEQTKVRSFVLSTLNHSISAFALISHVWSELLDFPGQSLLFRMWRTAELICLHNVEYRSSHFTSSCSVNGKGRRTHAGGCKPKYSWPSVIQISSMQRFNDRR
jgi:hypothetical protein